MCYKGRHTLLLECLISFLRCMRKMGGISNCTYNVPHGIQCAISAKIESQTACKLTDLSGFSEILCYKEWQPLLLERFSAFLQCMTMIRGASNNIYKAPHGLHCVISAKIESQMDTYKEIPDSGYPLRVGIDMLCYKKRHSLLINCLITFLRCMKKIEGALHIILEPLMVLSVSFLLRFSHKLHK